jgi:hypothetical protein
MSILPIETIRRSPPESLPTKLCSSVLKGGKYQTRDQYGFFGASKPALYKHHTRGVYVPKAQEK